VRRLVLVGTGPRGGQNMATFTPEAQQIFGATYKVPEELWLKVHFTDSQASQAAGREFLKRFLRRTENRDPEVNEKVRPPRSRPSASGACSVRVPMSISRPSGSRRW